MKTIETFEQHVEVLRKMLKDDWPPIKILVVYEDKVASGGASNAEALKMQILDVIREFKIK